MVYLVRCTEHLVQELGGGSHSGEKPFLVEISPLNRNTEEEIRLASKDPLLEAS